MSTKHPGQIAGRDENFVTGIVVRDFTDDTKTVVVKGDPATGRMLVSTTATLAGQNLPISGATTAVGVAIVDGSGNQITSFGGGTQYTDGGVPPGHPVGGTLEWSDGANWQTVSTAKPLPITVVGTPAVTVSGVATASNQTGGSQKTQIVDGSGNVIAATSNALNTSITNSTLAVTQSTSPWVVSGTVNPTTPTTVQYGQATVSVTNTAVQLSNQAVTGVVIQALAANAGNVVIGDASVATGTGFQLQPGQATGIAISNVNKLYVNGTSGDGVCWIGS